MRHHKHVLLAQSFETVSIDAITAHPANPRRGDLDAITDSITAHGFFGACVVQRSSGHILIGNHRWLAARAAGETSVPVLYVDVDDEVARRIMVADNRTAELASWDMAALHAVLSELSGTEDGLGGIGFTEDDLAALTAELDEPERSPDVLDATDVLLGDPRHDVKLGEVYALGPHVLVVANVTTGWPQWLPYLKPGVIFCPHPSPYLPFSTATERGALLMVTSSPFLAGHVLDKWEAAGEAIEAVA